MKAKPIQPKFSPGDIVNYVDRHGRYQSGARIMDIDGFWRKWGVSIKYRIKHPTYQNGYAYVPENNIEDFKS